MPILDRLVQGLSEVIWTKVNSFISRIHKTTNGHLEKPLADEV